MQYICIEREREICMCISIYTYISCIYIYMRVCTYTCAYSYTHVCIYTCIYKHACIYIIIYVYIYIHIINSYTRVHLCLFCDVGLSLDALNTQHSTLNTQPSTLNYRSCPATVSSPALPPFRSMSLPSPQCLSSDVLALPHLDVLHGPM